MTGLRTVGLALALLLRLAAPLHAQYEPNVTRLFLGTGECIFQAGSNSPQGVVAGKYCDTYWDTTSGVIYVKKTATGNTGWQATAAVGTLASTDLTDTANLARLNAANSFTLINPLTTIAESWIGPSSTTGIYFKGGNVGIGATNPSAPFHIHKAAAAGVVGAQLLLTNAGVAVGEVTAVTFGAGSPLRAEIRSTVENDPYHGTLEFWTGVWTLTERMRITSTGVTVSAPLGTTDYVAQTTGWRVTAPGAADFRYLFTDELHAKAFVADIEQALVGGQIIAKSVVVVAAAFTLPAQGASTTFIVEDIANMAAVDVFVAGDFVRFRQFTRGVNTLDVADAWGTISATAHTHNGDGTQTWTFVRSATPNEGTATGTITRGQLVIDYGVSGNGLIEATVLDGSGQANAPYTRYLTWTAHPKTGQAVRTQIGQLKGITSTAEFGLLAGAYAATDGQYFRASDQNFELHGIDLSLWDGATNVFAVRRNSTSPYLSLGSPAPSTYGANAGIFLGWSHASTKAQASFYADANNYWQYDGSKLTWKAANTTLDASGNLTASSATLSGAITASSGAIGGWSVGATALTDTAGVVGMSSAVTGGDDIRFWAGHATPASAPFQVTEAGALTASSGTIGGFTLGANLLSSGSGATYVAMSSGGTNAFWAGDSTFADAPFSVTAAGALKATSATITGTVNATAGFFGTDADVVAVSAAGLSIGDSGSIGTGSTTWASGTGCWMGNDSGVYKFRCSDAGTVGISWDGSYVRLWSPRVQYMPYNPQTYLVYYNDSTLELTYGLPPFSAEEATALKGRVAVLEQELAALRALLTQHKENR